MANDELMLMSGSAHPGLAVDIAGLLRTDLTQVSIGQFPDGESSIRIDKNVRERDVFLIQPTGRSKNHEPNHNIMECLLIVESLRRASARSITVVMPYFAYARQDRKENPGVPISARLVVDLFEAAGVDKFLSVDLHSDQIQEFASVPFNHLSARPTISAKLINSLDNLLVIAPDTSAAHLAESYAITIGCEFAVYAKKRIDSLTVKRNKLSGPSVQGKTALLVDDMASTMATILSAAKELKKQGAKRVVAAVTHGVLSGEANDKIAASSDLDELFITDSLSQKSLPDKIKIISIAPLLAEAIRCIHTGESIQ